MRSEVICSQSQKEVKTTARKGLSARVGSAALFAKPPSVEHAIVAPSFGKGSPNCGRQRAQGVQTQCFDRGFRSVAPAFGNSVKEPVEFLLSIQLGIRHLRDNSRLVDVQILASSRIQAKFCLVFRLWQIPVLRPSYIIEPYLVCLGHFLIHPYADR